CIPEPDPRTRGEAPGSGGVRALRVHERDDDAAGRAGRGEPRRGPGRASAGAVAVAADPAAAPQRLGHALPVRAPGDAGRPSALRRRRRPAHSLGSDDGAHSAPVCCGCRGAARAPYGFAPAGRGRSASAVPVPEHERETPFNRSRARSNSGRREGSPHQLPGIRGPPPRRCTRVGHVSAHPRSRTGRAMSPGTPPERIRDSPAPDSTVLRSRDLAELAGTTPRALRHYHRSGLLPEVPRDPNGYRRYSIRVLVTLLRIRQL